jgi:hypothetical protein
MSDPVSSVPPVEFGPRGFIAPPESEILVGVQADMNAAFGGNMNPALETPQGQLASSMTAIIGEANNVYVKLTQQVDPAYADGRMQDAIARIYFLERHPAEPTVVEATVTGLAGTVIPQGALAQSTDNNLYAAQEDITIPSGGSTTGTFACTVYGPIPCPAASLSMIYKAIPGWDTITNAADGVTGNDAESRQNFEFRRAQSVFLNSVGSVSAIQAAVMAVPNVLDAYVTDNDSGSPATKGGVLIPAHSVFVAAVGGDDQAVAQAIWSKKAPGCGYYAGNVTETVYDTSPGYVSPYPAYTVKFENPAALPILFEVTIVSGPTVPSDAASQIQAAIIAAFTGSDGGARARIGSTVYASRYYAPVVALGSWVSIVSILVGTSAADQNAVTVNINRVPTLSASDISVVLV